MRRLPTGFAAPAILLCAGLALTLSVSARGALAPGPDLGPLPTASAAAQEALERGRASLRGGDEAGAEARWRAQLGRHRDVGLLDALGSLYFHQKRLSKAEACYERLVRWDRGSAKAWYRLGLVRAARGRYKSASDAQRLAVGLAPDFGPAYCALALDLRENGQASMSAWAVRRALVLMPRYAGAWNLLGALQQDAGRLDEARGSYDSALTLAPAYPGAWFNLAQWWQLRKQRDLALRCYGKAIEAEPGFAEARLARAELFLDAMDSSSLESARKDFSACLALEDWAPEAWWGLRRVDAAEGRRAAAARDLHRYYAGMRRRDRAQARLEARGEEEPSPYEPGLPPQPSDDPLEAQP